MEFIANLFESKDATAYAYFITVFEAGGYYSMAVNKSSIRAVKVLYCAYVRQVADLAVMARYAFIQELNVVVAFSADIYKTFTDRQRFRNPDAGQHKHTIHNLISFVLRNGKFSCSNNFKFRKILNIYIAYEFALRVNHGQIIKLVCFEDVQHVGYQLILQDR